MSEIEHGHAIAFLQKLNLSESNMPSPSFRVKALNRIGKIFGYDYVLGVLMDTEKSLSNSIKNLKRKRIRQSPDQNHFTFQIVIVSFGDLYIHKFTNR